MACMICSPSYENEDILCFGENEDFMITRDLCHPLSTLNDDDDSLQLAEPTKYLS